MKEFKFIFIYIQKHFIFYYRFVTPPDTPPPTPLLLFNVDGLAFVFLQCGICLCALISLNRLLQCGHSTKPSSTFSSIIDCGIGLPDDAARALAIAARN